ncbi:protein SSUH2 homolog isoform X2 [Mauremys mutica]|uniref:protein SSUH2 homolog isoform X2 n=1 Tax=Mauremys mutica TaxID=74926 RepID=UPI001D16042E|nr:protein SSUH2 homolog isoform X2 [Mauremys mutica]
MEQELQIGNESRLNYGSECLLSPSVAQDAPASYSLPHDQPSAPPLELMDRATEDEGEDSGDYGNKGLPPPADQLPEGEHSDSIPPQTEWSILAISDHVAREALVQYIANKCCYRIAPAKRMVVQNLTPLNTFRYRLQTFTETRETFPISEPYNGGFVDSSDVAPAPAPWAIVVDAPPLFTDCEMHIPVPHTYSVQDCPNCQGHGKNQCHLCSGSGKRRCTACNGTGWQDSSNQSCLFCSGSGKRCCSDCHGGGWQKCIRCSGKGLLLYHSELTITWKNSVAEYVVDKNFGFPIYHLQEVTGKEIFSDENQVVYPIVNFPEPAIDRGSESCIAQHQMQFASNSRILRQKQTIELIPLTKVEYEWRGKVYSFCVFGNENKVYTEDYPAKCCCSVM